MTEMSHTCKDHRDAILVTGFNDFLITNGTTWLDNRFDARFGNLINIICKGKKASEASTALSRFFPVLLQLLFSLKLHGLFDQVQPQVFDVHL